MEVMSDHICLHIRTFRETVFSKVNTTDGKMVGALFTIHLFKTKKYLKNQQSYYNKLHHHHLALPIDHFLISNVEVGVTKKFMFQFLQ